MSASLYSYIFSAPHYIAICGTSRSTVIYTFSHKSHDLYP